MQKVTPFLWFNAQAEEAARFYVSLFEDSRIESVTRLNADTPSGPAGTVVTVEFTLGGTRFLALDGGPQFPFTEAVSFQVACDDQVEADRLWDALCDGGTPGPCGWLKDRWGLSWQVVPNRVHELIQDADPARARRAIDALLRMGRLDVAAMERAADGTQSRR
ncbi:MAG: VOC family protein [Chloroflexota bacterium]